MRRACRTILPLRRITLALVVLAALATPALAHQSSVTYSRVAVGDDGLIDYTLLINSRDLFEALGLDKDRDASDSEITSGEARIFEYVLGRVRAGAGDGVDCTTERRGLKLVNQSDRFAELRFVTRCPVPLLKVSVAYDLFFDLDRGHVGMLQVTHHGKTVSRELKKGVNTFEWRLPATGPISYKVLLEPRLATPLAEKVADYVRSHLVVSADGDIPCPSTVRTDDASPPGGLVTVSLEARCTSAFTTLRFSTNFFPEAQGPVGKLLVQHGKRYQEFALTAGRAELVWGVTDAETPSSTSLIDFIGKGMHHIYSGYDHICFLIGLLLIAVLRPRRWDTTHPWESAPVRAGAGYVLKTVTAFTLAHSITLIAAALGWIDLPSRIVEATIAASIVYVAVENLWTRDVSSRWLLAFGFGLVHGLGFAAMLKPMLPPQGLVLPLVMFNVGVELGQLSIVAILFPILAALATQNADRYRRYVLIGGSGLVGIFGMLWLIERLFEVMTISRYL